MTPILITLSVWAGATTVSTILLAYKLSKNTPAKRDMRLLEDLMVRGRATIRVERIAPGEHFIRSPKDIM
jgi:hypothetical protein